MMHVHVLGLGPGNPDLLTLAGRRAIQEADLLIGAERLLQDLPEGKPSRRIVHATRASEIVACLQDVRTGGSADREQGTAAHFSDHENGAGADIEVAVVMSGDIGLFSGTKSLLGLLDAEKDAFEIELIPGISSVQYFAAALKRPWQSWHCVSAHGIACDVAAEVARNKEVFFVTGGDNTVAVICRTLCDSGLGNCSVTVGERLSYTDEKLHSGMAQDFVDQGFDDLSVMLVEGATRLETAQGDRRPSSWNWAQTGIPDGCFKRARVPMTKQEVRAVMLAKLKVAAEDVVYDIGSGSGSASVELALLATRGTVYAIEHKPDAVALTKENLAHFGIENANVIEGLAPQALAELPVPDAAFIGGSSGNLEDILTVLVNKNAAVRLCVACVTIETLAEASRLLSSDGFSEFEVCQVSVARSEAVGRYSMLKAQNPIFLVSATGNDAQVRDGVVNAGGSETAPTEPRGSVS